MPDFTVRVFQVQLLNGYADVSMTGDTTRPGCRRRSHRR